jgi:3-methylcrotonyl-CoA carboxylase alpha subunit
VAKRWRVENEFGQWTVELSDDRVTILESGSSFRVRDTAAGRVGLEDDGGALTGVSARSADTVWVAIDGEVFANRVHADAPGAMPMARGQELLTAPMPATVVRVAVRPGDRVSAGDTLIVLEAMKMELPIRAPRDATVAAVHCVEGQLVQPDQELIDLT